MKSFKTVLPILCGAIAGAIVALIIANGNGGTKTVTDIVAQTGKSVPTALSKGTGMSVNDIYKQDSPGVVDIDVTSVSQGTNNGFFSTGPTTSEDEGAGVVYDMKGDIVTDEHVVAGATKVVVHFQDGYSADAKVLGTDPSTDVAVIRVQNTPASELHPIAFADSNDAQVGDSVVAIGSPFGLPETVTAGIVSATGRSIEAPNGYTIPGAIQTDAAINPGNSGGPLLDAAGQVLGLNDQIETDSTNDEGEGSSAGVGFATPANTDVEVADTIISGKKVEHPYVGVCLEDATSGSGAEIVPNAGSSSCSTGPIAAGSPAAKAGLEPGEVVTGVDGKAITSADDFITIISNYKPGDTITLTIRSSVKSTATSKVKVTLGDRPESVPTAS